MDSIENEEGTTDTEGLVWCFQCGNEYDEDVAECTECGVPTTDQAPALADNVGSEEDEQLAYEFHEWTGQGRSTLDGMLTRSGIEHAWQGATLIVREADEEAVDSAVAEAEVTSMPTLDLTQPTIIYELADLDDDQHARLTRRLGEQGLSHAFDRKGDLFVYESDEEKIDELFASLDDADDVEREFGPGIDVNPVEVMSDLFVAAGRLRKNPNDAKGVVALVENASLVDQMTLPYGMTGDVWGQVVDQSADLSDALSGEDTALPDVDVQEMATELHGLMRQLV